MGRPHFSQLFYRLLSVELVAEASVQGRHLLQLVQEILVEPLLVMHPCQQLRDCSLFFSDLLLALQPVALLSELEGLL